LATAVTGNSSIAAWQAVAILLYWPFLLPLQKRRSHPEGVSGMNGHIKNFSKRYQGLA
jgi:hypothetical protein